MLIREVKGAMTMSANKSGTVGLAVGNDAIDTVGPVIAYLTAAQLRLEQLMIGARESDDVLTWFAYNDAAHSVQRAISALVATNDGDPGR
jgi:hypothetical protein